jgi:hypothetical protein
VHGRKIPVIANWKRWQRPRARANHDLRDARFRADMTILPFRLQWTTMPVFCATAAFEAAMKCEIILYWDEWAKALPRVSRSI